MNEYTGTSLTLRQILLEQQSTPARPDLAPDMRPSDEATALGSRLDGVPATLRTLAAEQVIVMLAARVLDRRLVDLLNSGWQKWEQLVEAAERSLADPGEVGIVELVDHEISSIQHPSIEVTYDGRRVAEIGAEVAVDIRVHAATAVVESGRLSALRSGRADIDARLSIQGVLVAEAKRKIELAIEIPLGDGITLIEQPGPATSLLNTRATTEVNLATRSALHH